LFNNSEPLTYTYFLATYQHAGAQTAAIMFTYIIGYTALMGSNEDHAFEVLRKNRDIHSTLIEQINGHLFKELGDGMFISFRSSVGSSLIKIVNHQTELVCSD